MPEVLFSLPGGYGNAHAESGKGLTRYVPQEFTMDGVNVLNYLIENTAFRLARKGRPRYVSAASEQKGIGQV